MSTSLVYVELLNSVADCIGTYHILACIHSIRKVRNAGYALYDAKRMLINLHTRIQQHKARVCQLVTAAHQFSRDCFCL